MQAFERLYFGGDNAAGFTPESTKTRYADNTFL